MFNVRNILSRSWHVLWNYRVLWIFGFFLALATAGGNAGNQSNYSFSGDEGNRPNRIERWQGWDNIEGDSFAEVFNSAMREFGDALRMLQEQYPEEFRLAIAAAITAFVVILLLGLLMAVLRYVSEASTIHMVDAYEETGVKVGFRQGWRYGWNRSAWQLFLVNFLVHLPVLGLFVILGLMGWWVFSALMTGVEWNIITSIVAGAGLAFLFIFITAIMMAVLYVVRDFAWRMIVLEGAGTGDSLRQAWALVRRQWKNAGLMWLVMVGIKIAWGIAFIILIIPLLILSVLTAVGGIAAALIPSLLTVGIASIFSPDYWPWIFAAIIGGPIFLAVTFSPIIFVEGLAKVYESSVWTLTYRELKALEAIDPNEDPGEAPAAPEEMG